MSVLNEISLAIREIVDQQMRLLKDLPEEVVSGRFNVQDRNIKMLLGHMVDSASNNQQRMVRLQYAPRCGWSMPDANVGMLVSRTILRTMTFGSFSRTTAVILWRNCCSYGNAPIFI